MSDYEQGRAAIERLRDWYNVNVADRNEATTRLQLIDRIFFDSLGWSKESDTTLEEPHGKEYADYVFSSPNRLLIVEAKREGDYFELPVGRERLEYSLISLCRDFPNLKAALEQVASYSQRRGTPFAAVSNGHQIIAFVASRSDGIPPLEGQALVFPSLDFMLKNFHDLWQNVSKEAVLQSRLYNRLVANLSPEVPPKLSASISDYPGVKARNVFQTDLQILSELVLEDIGRSPELETQFLESTYCQSGALSQHALTSKKILKSRYEAIFDEQAPGPTVVSADERKAASKILAESLSRRPILLIGDVGVGKTTFIQRLLKVDAKEEFANAIAIYIDFGSKATLGGDLSKWVLSEFAEQLKTIHLIDIYERNFVHGIYRVEVLGFRKGIYGDLRESNPEIYRIKEVEFLDEKLKRHDEHLRKSLEHISVGRKKQVVVFLDNADQRRDIEEQVFLISHELANNYAATVFVTIRPETFHRSRSSGVLSAYHPKAFSISPPRIERVIVKRLQFAQKITSGEIPVRNLSSSVELPRLGKILKSFEVSLDRNPDLVECIDNMASGNVRLALDYVKAFFGSGHVDTQKIADICDSGNIYTVPVHEFIRSLVFGDAKHFSPSTSAAFNVFDVSDADPHGHFLILMLISLLQKEGQISTESGFVEAQYLVSKLQDSGFSPTQARMAIARACRGALSESSGGIDPSICNHLSYKLRVTTKGLYHALRLSRMFTYLDAITVDLPVFDDSCRRGLRDTFVISERINRARQILEYLNSVWNSFKQNADIFDWETIAASLKSDIDEVEKRTNF
jgi:hypothetical protein